MGSAPAVGSASWGPAKATPGGQRRLSHVGAAAGIVVVLGATFAPWIASGTTTRSLYGAAGAGEQLLRLSAPAAAAVAALPFVGLAFAVAILLWLAGRAAAAAVLMLVLDVAAIAAGAVTLPAPRTGPVHAVAIGPVLLICGALINLAAILSAARGARSRATHADAPSTVSRPKDSP